MCWKMNVSNLTAASQDDESELTLEEISAIIRNEIAWESLYSPQKGRI